MKNLIKSVRNGNATVPKWKTSAAKKILKDDIISGNVTDDMNPKDVWESNDEYKKYEFSNFKSNLENLKMTIYTQMEQMEADCLHYGHDLALLELIREFDPVDPVPWHKSEAKPLLEQAIDEGKHLAMKPRELYEERVEYRAFSLDVFRDHIYQEVKKRENKAAGKKFAKKKTRMRAPRLGDSAVVGAPCRNQDQGMTA